MEIRYNVTGDRRKALVKVISETIGEDAVYRFMPTCNYDIGGYTVTKDGTLIFSDCSDSEEVEKLLDAIADAGFECETKDEPEADTGEDTGYQEPEDSAREDATGQEPEVNTEEGYTSQEPEANTEEGYTSQEPEANTEVGYTSQEPEANTEVGYTSQEPEANTGEDTVIQEPEANTEEGYTGQEPEINTGEDTVIQEPETTSGEGTVIQEPEPAAGENTADQEETAERAPDDTNGLCFSLPREGMSNTAIENLRKIVDSKANLIRKSLDTDSLEIAVTEDTISFPWWNRLPQPEETKTYSAFICALYRMAKDAKRVTVTKKDVESEKYAFRSFLLRLGFAGEGNKEHRRILLKNLSGSSAFPNREKADAFSAAQKVKRDAAKAAARSESTAGANAETSGISEEDTDVPGEVAD